MSFQALARSWRPRRFDELVGQTHVVRALTHALDNDKLHHALLFSGTRGVGKTTLARIIAKCLNCEHGVRAHPCRGEDACGTCREIDEGRFIDLIEVDAASRTGVDDTRDLMDNVQYAPSRGRTKVYLIDEVHMLTKHSFNALLKTLEEPPPRVQFLLATTEPEKIPVTILSRCLQFPLKRLPVAEIDAQLQHIVSAESLQAEEGALTEIARAADGSMRDGLSLLDQAIAFGGGRLATDDVRNMLGTIGQARVNELVNAIVTADVATALAALDALYAQGIDMRYLLDAIATAWQHIATIHVVGDVIDEAAEPWRDAAEKAEPRAVQLFYDITVGGVRDLPYAPDPLVGVKMSVLRMLAFAPVAPDDGSSPKTGGGQTKSARPATETAQSGAAAARAQLQAQASPRDTRADTPAAAISTRPDRATARAEAPPQSQSTIDPAAQESAQPNVADAADVETAPAANSPALAEERTEVDHPQDWHTLVPKLELSGLTAQLAHNGVCRHLDGERIVLALARTNEFLATPTARDALQAALSRLWAPSSAPQLQMEFVDSAPDTPAQRRAQDAEQEQRDAVASIENDPMVGQLRDRLGARVRTETIKPNNGRSTAAPQRDEQ